MKSKLINSLTKGTLFLLTITLFTTFTACDKKDKDEKSSNSSTSNSSSSNNSSSSSFNGLRNVMYYGDWSIWGGQDNFYPKDIPADALTHLNFAFMDFNSEGELEFTDKGASCESPVGLEGVTWGDANAGILAAFQGLKAENPNLKIGVSLGGWSKSGDFAKVAANSKARANLISNTLEFIKYTNMDFVDIDWEYPGDKRDPDTCDNQNDEGGIYNSSDDKENFVTLLKEFKEALNKQEKELNKSYELSVALPCSISKIEAGINIKEVFKIVDFANIMTYDMRGAWDNITGHQTPLYTNPKDPMKGKGLSIDESVEYYLKNGAKENKIVIGAAYYTRGWEETTEDGPDSDNPGLFAEVSTNYKDADQKDTSGANNEAPLKNGDGGRRGGVWSYRSLDKLKAAYPNLKEYWDDTAKAPYLYDSKSGAFFTYDNEKSIKEKCKYVKEKNLGGMIAWMASEDAPSNGSTVRDKLTRVTKEGLFGSDPLPSYDISTSNLDISYDIKESKAEWETSSGYTLTISNNEKLSASGEVLQSVENTYKSLKNLKIYIKLKNGSITGGDWNSGTISKDRDYAVIDLSSTSTNKIIPAGGTVTLNLTCDSNSGGTDNIEEIYITERIYASGSEFNKKVLYSNSSSSSSSSNKDKSENNNEDKKKENSEGSNSNVDNSKNSSEYDSSKVYVGGDVVTYKGSKYKAKWWTQGEDPSSSAAWEKE